MSFADVENKVIIWGTDRMIVQNSTPYAQALKTKEELEELFDAIEKNDREAMIDAYGDIATTIILGCACADLDLVTCLKSAFEQIKSRKGYLNEQGIFVKEA